MQRRDVVAVIGLLAMAACLDRKSKSLDGATSDDGPVVEIGVLPGTGGAPGVDSATSIDLGQVLDGPAVPDVPVTTPDARPVDVPSGSGGVSGTGGTVGSMDVGSGGGAGGTAGAGGATVNPDVPPALLPNGSPCASATGCTSGICADGVCCNNACSGCNACARTLTGQPDGVCAPVSSGADPHNTCADETATNQCGNDGACDGSGACRKVATSHQCAAATCVGSTFTPASFCDGKGACTTVSPQSCGAFQCSVTEGCRTTCTIQADCGSQSYCNTATGSCLPKVATGGACTQALACVSGSCVDAVCCENTCTGACKACSAAKTGASDGLCRPVKVGTDPDTECTADTGNACGLDGMCDGVGGCRYQVTGTPCGTASCTGEGTYTPRGQCNGSGTCMAGSPGNCPNNMLCASSTSCTTTCTDRSTTGCPSGYKCVGGSSCQLIGIPCNAASCRPIDNSICCMWTPYGTSADTPWTYTCESEAACVAREWSSRLTCGSRADCPTGQFCCVNGISCDGTGRTTPLSRCTSNVSECQDGPQNWGAQACDPALTPTECMTGTCLAFPCIHGTYTCQ